MSGNVTVSVKSILLAGLVLLGLVTAYLLGGNGDVVAPSAAAAPQDEPAAGTARTMKMVASGEATAVPDEMTFALSVTSKKLDLDDALAASSASMRRVLAVLEDEGVKRSDVQTTGLSMYPEYDYPAYSPPVLTGYRVTQKAQVHVRELAKGGGAVSSAVEAGGNGVRVSDIRLEVGDPDAVLSKARDAAVDSATAKAKQYAAAAGQTLGDVVSIREVSAPPRRDVWSQSLTRATYDSANLAAFKLPIRAGKDDLTVRIEVVWEFE
jgi:uncharacterized protein YggE